MKQFTFEDKTIDMVENWEEVTFERFINYLRLAEKKYNMDDEIEKVQYLFHIVSIFSNRDYKYVSSLFEDDLATLFLYISEFIAKIPDIDTLSPIINSNGIIYTVKNNNKISGAEKISIMMIQKTFKGLDAWPYLASILWRPSKEYRDVESGLIKYKQEEYDGDKLEDRKNILLQLPALNLVKSIGFFLNGMSQSIDNMKDSTKAQQEIPA